MAKITTVEEYLDNFPADTKKQLVLLRKLIKQTAPEAIEKMSWGVPTYNLNGFLIQFAAYKNHIGFYTSPSVIKHFKAELNSYKTNSKNTVQFPLNHELPAELIKQMIQYKVKENLKCA